MMMYRVKSFSELTAKEFWAIARLRVAVFVVEQHCPYQEIDEQDVNAWHTWLEEDGEIIGYTRIMANETHVSFGRVLIHPLHRKKHLGNQLLEKTIQVIDEKYPKQSIIIEAQAHLTAFYGAFGFTPISAVFLEDGIPHIRMKK